MIGIKSGDYFVEIAKNPIIGKKISDYFLLGEGDGG